MVIRCLTKVLGTDNNLVAAVADDLGLVLENVWTQVPLVLLTMGLWTQASAMELNLFKCVLVPLFHFIEDEIREAKKGMPTCGCLHYF